MGTRNPNLVCGNLEPIFSCWTLWIWGKLFNKDPFVSGLQVLWFINGEIRKQLVNWYKCSEKVILDTSLMSSVYAFFVQFTLCDMFRYLFNENDCGLVP